MSSLYPPKILYFVLWKAKRALHRKLQRNNMINSMQCVLCWQWRQFLFIPPPQLHKHSGCAHIDFLILSVRYDTDATLNINLCAIQLSKCVKVCLNWPKILICYVLAEPLSLKYNMQHFKSYLGIKSWDLQMCERAFTIAYVDPEKKNNAY